MKIRQGFVSNSSSSSFVVYVDRVKIPPKVERELLRHGEELYWERFDYLAKYDKYHHVYITGYDSVCWVDWIKKYGADIPDDWSEDDLNWFCKHVRCKLHDDNSSYGLGHTNSGELDKKKYYVLTPYVLKKR